MVRGKLYKTRPTGNKVQLYLWIGCFITGFLTGCIQFIINLALEGLGEIKMLSVDPTSAINLGLGWLVFIAISIVYVMIAASLTVYVAPEAQGSGMAETMGYLNGV